MFNVGLTRLATTLSSLNQWQTWVLKLPAMLFKLRLWFCFSCRSSDWMLRRTREPLPAASLLPLSSRQHDRRALRRARRLGPRLRDGGPLHGQCRRPRSRGRVSAPAPALHGPRPPAGGPLHGHGGHDEASFAESGGRACINPALVFLRSATDWQAALGSAQHFQGLRRSGYPQPAPTTRACNSTRTYSGGLRASGSGRRVCSPQGADASGELNLNRPQARQCKRRRTWHKTELKLILLLLCALRLFLQRRATSEQRSASAGILKNSFMEKRLSLFWFYTLKFWPFFEVYLTVPMETRLQKANFVRRFKGFSWQHWRQNVCQFPLKFCSETIGKMNCDYEATGF